MDSFVEFFKSIMRNVPRPSFYGGFHLSFLLSMVVVIVLVIIFMRKLKSDFAYRMIMLGFWLVFITMETLKQLSWAFGSEPIGYKWWTFPFQLCSLPYYLLPFLFALKPNKIRSFVASLMMSFVLLGGLAVMLVPGTLCEFAFVNYHTMAHHSLQVISAVVCFVWYRGEAGIKHFLKGVPVFLGLMILALVLDVLINNYSGGVICLWNLSPIRPLDMDILQNIRDAVGYPLYFILYFVIASAIGALIYMSPLGIRKLSKFLIEKRKARA